MALKYLVIVRHGQYNSNHLLTPEGEAQIESTMAQVIQHIGDAKLRIRILSSGTLRAIHSALIGARLLMEGGARIDGIIAPPMGNFYTKLFVIIDDMIAHEQFEVMFLFGHMEDLERFGCRFGPHIQKEPVNIRGVYADQNRYGTAQIINMETFESTIIQPNSP